MIYKPTAINDVSLILPEHHKDERGLFVELFGAQSPFFPKGVKQISQSTSRYGVVRGLHFQYAPSMGKIMRVIRGAAWIVNVDMRRDSSTFMEHVGIICTPENEIMIHAPGWCARGFAALEDDTVVEYFHDEVYNPRTSVTIAWDDPALGIEWNVADPILSEADRNGLYVQEWVRCRASRFA